MPTVPMVEANESIGCGCYGIDGDAKKVRQRKFLMNAELDHRPVILCVDEPNFGFEKAGEARGRR
jgi:hypothetical protein